ncbi:putative bud22/Serum response factor-binding protein [Plasmopara halstedii]
MISKRKRDAFSTHEKLVHKSCTLLQREAKKVRTLMMRRMLQQLKQLKQQHVEPIEDAVKQQKRECKLRHSIERLEREHLTLKMMDLAKFVTKAKLQTGLVKPQPPRIEHGSELLEDDSNEESIRQNMQVVNKNIKDIEVNMVKGADHVKIPSDREEKLTDGKLDTELEKKLIERLLAHKKIMPLLDAIRKLVEKSEKDADKKRRAQEKRALKRGRHESLVGNTGRSGAVPTSLFLGSLSGRGEMDASEEMSADGYGAMASADDDIAEFLGEKKKKKNRPGQTARRMKALRKEEAQKRKENREKGIHVPYEDKSVLSGQYGLSERPKKAKQKSKLDKKNKAVSNRVKLRAGLKDVEPQSQRLISASSVDVAHPSWLAKQMQKEKEKISFTAFTGKKITF